MDPGAKQLFKGPKGPLGPLGPERSDFLRGPLGPLGPERSDFLRGPKAPWAPWDPKRENTCKNLEFRVKVGLWKKDVLLKSAKSILSSS